jgi:hypothetical protein
MDAVVDTRMAGDWRGSAASRSSTSRGPGAVTTSRTTVLERIATARTTRSRPPGRGVQAAHPRRPDRSPHRGDPRGRFEGRRRGDTRCRPQFGPFSAEHGADLFLVQSQVSSARHIATEYDPLSLAEFTRYMPIPVAVGNTTNAEAAFSLMEQGAAAVFVGVGPGAACTTREVLGIGVPQVTAISDVAAARDAYFSDTGRYVPVVADGGMRRGGELAKAIAAGADVLMIGSPLARPRKHLVVARTGAWRRRRPRSRAALGSRSGPSARSSASCSALPM